MDSLGRVAGVLFLLLTTACTPSLHERRQLAQRLADDAGLQYFQSSGDLPLAGYFHLHEQGQPLWIFIAGDGYAWVTPSLPSQNPTPLNPVALRLAAATKSPNVLYIARPGQYVMQHTDNRYWLEARFAPQVLEAMLAVARSYLAQADTRALHLVGYSGGGALAALMAENLVADSNYRVLGLVTLAGNLDTDFWTQSLGLSPLSESLNPADRAALLADLPQRHLTGSKDQTVPTSVLHSFLEKMGSSRCVSIISLPLAHSGPWVKAWQQARLKPLSC